MSEPLSAIASARELVRVLCSGGVYDVVLCPGSRSAPLAYALADAEAAGLMRLHVRIDERAAGFTALGFALGAQRPVGVVTTSGTAVGELLPAVMEANHAAVPLVVLSADRPAELRGTGANQTTHQPGIFGVHVRFAVDIPAGTCPADSARHALSSARGYGTITDETNNHLAKNAAPHPPGPVHLNIAFRDPLVPASRPAIESVAKAGAEYEADRATRRDAELVRPAGTPASAGSPAHQGSGSHTVVVAGHDATALAAVFAAHLDLPLFAEPSSNARFGSSAIAPYRLLLDLLGRQITKVVVFGRPTLSRPVAALLSRADVEHVLYVPKPVAWFEPGRRRERIISTLAELLDFAGRGATRWLPAWRHAGALAEAAIQDLLASEPGLTGLAVADMVWEHTDGNLVVGSSNPIRDLDLIAATDWHPLEVYANRGLAGIDGTLATATGIALASGVPTRLLVGDLTFLHDVGGMFLGSGEPEPDLQVVVLNDGGGGIFGLLEHGAQETLARYPDAVERLFGTPHAVDLSALAAAYGVRFERVDTLEDLERTLDAPVSGRSIVEVRASRPGLRDLHARIATAARRAVAGCELDAVGVAPAASSG